MIIPVAPRGRVPTEILSVPGRPCRLRGGILAAHLEWLYERLGPEGLPRIREALPAAFRDFDPADFAPAAWIPYGLLVSIDKAIARTVAPGHEERIYVALGRHSAMRSFGSTPKAATVHHHFWTGKVHHAEFGDFGTCSYVPLEAHALRMEYRQYPVLSRVFCLSAHGFFEGSVELFGGHEPIVEETTCQCYGDEACAYVVSWEP